MELLSIVVLKEKADEIADLLITTGSFHPFDIREIQKETGSLTQFQAEKEKADVAGLESSLGNILGKTGVETSGTRQVELLSPADARERFSEIENAVLPLVEEKDKINRELESEKSLFLTLESYFPFPLKNPSFYSFLETLVGKLDEKDLTSLEGRFAGIPHLFYPFRREDKKVVVLLIVLKSGKNVLEHILKGVSWEPVEYPAAVNDLSEKGREKMKSGINSLREQLQDTEKKIAEKIKGFSTEISQVLFFISYRKALFDARRNSYMTDRTAVLSGWVPAEEKEKVLTAVRKVITPVFFKGTRAEDLALPKEEVPVRLRHGFWLKPFEILISSYGIPRYGTIDPTIFIAFTFPLLFGAMFGDLGQGLVLAATGLFLARQKKEDIRKAGMLLSYCGFSAAVFGFLYGSAFGVEFSPLWVKPIESTMKVFTAGIIFGIILITTGICLNLANSLRDRNYLKAVFDNAGLASGLMYWAGIGIITKVLVSSGRVPVLFPVLMGAGFLVLAAKPVAEKIIEKKKGPVFISFTENAIDIMEIIMGYLANTVSFLRVAAFALAHAGLFMAIFYFANLLRGAAGTTFFYSTLILGNVLIILLEGLVVSIQSVRLNYYEFFSRFFVTGKERFSPVTLEGRI